ncbi:uncharacterized protein LOC116721017 [Xiphophorus hellerii]|uniref:uncharacterized protein LOC116721017 n=1 Tax=Xiphophorus hellerii TaxID=8084 RepID=UPI0013B428A5|nr:uncharacterized protein LOC116721017 [Xiphophorus hellerii]
MKVLVGWCDPTCEAKWKEVDLSYRDIPLQSWLGDHCFIKKHIDSDLIPLWIKGPLDIWHKILKQVKTERNARILRWPVYDRDFLPARMDKRFTQWSQKGITSYWKITKNNELKSFKQLQDNYNLEKCDFFRYLQLRHYYNKSIKYLEEDEAGILKILLDSSNGRPPKKTISKLYACLQTERKCNKTYIKTKWEKEAKITINEEVWLNICNSVIHMSSSGLWKEFSWKCLVRFFVTPNIKSKYCNDTEKAKCWRNSGNVSAGHFHIFWECIKIAPYWSEVIKEINTKMDLNLCCDFTVVFLGNLPRN